MPRSVWLRDAAARDGFENTSTVCLLVPFLSRRTTQPVQSFEATFRSHYEAIRELLNSHRSSGLALLVVGAERLEAAAWIPVEADGISPVILGRHSTAELFLPRDPELALRHLAVILRRASDGRACFRVLDLRTITAFEDEQGQALRALEAAGPTMVRCASYALLLFPTGDSDEPWPEDAGAGWSLVPERTYLDSQSADPASWNRPGAVAVRWVSGRRSVDTQTTSVVTFPGPAFLRPATRPMLVPMEAGSTRGELRVDAPSGGGSLLLDAEAARRGALIGRYERCDGFGLPCLEDRSLSRVHLLVVESEGSLWAIDTASKNGTWHHGEPVRRLRLEAGRQLLLAGQVSVEWWPYH